MPPASTTSPGRHGEAALLLCEALKVFRDTLGDDHPRTRTVAANYARLLRAHFRDDPALAELEAVVGADIGK